jgi:hypothetical protein
MLVLSGDKRDAGLAKIKLSGRRGFSLVSTLYGGNVVTYFTKARISAQKGTLN